VAGDWRMGGERPLPLHMALRYNDGDMVRLLASFGADMNAPSLEGRSACSWAHGSESCLAWIESGGDPWKVEFDESSGTRACMAHHQARGGSEAVWKVIQERLPAGANPNPPCEIDRGHSRDKDLSELAVRWSNHDALKTIGALGGAFSPGCLEDVLMCMAWKPGRDGARYRRMGALLVELGAPMPSEQAIKHVASMVGEKSARAAASWLEQTGLEIERKALSKAASKRGSKKAGPRL
jgi:hypothetical protein